MNAKDKALCESLRRADERALGDEGGSFWAALPQAVATLAACRIESLAQELALLKDGMNEWPVANSVIAPTRHVHSFDVDNIVALVRAIEATRAT